MAEKNSITAYEAMDINPLIDSDGGTYRVKAVLTALSNLIEGNRLVEDSDDFDYGIARMLEVCASALSHMQKITEEADAAKINGQVA